MLPEFVQSPLVDVPSPLVNKERVGALIDAYRDEFGYDASGCFAGLSEIGLYRCPVTSLGFYYPFSIAGPADLYRTLQKFEWNYKRRKWEHDRAFQCLRAGDKTLDVGCGEGSFLELATQKSSVAIGIELNQSAALIARERGLHVVSETLHKHSIDREQFYDVVSAFQVLEHVTDCRLFIEDCIRSLRVGGTLLLGVPNDDGFVGMDSSAALNKPPHHMTLWKRSTLEVLAEIFPLQLITIDTEPLGEKGWYRAVMEKRYIKNGLMRSLYYRLGGARIFERFIEENAHTIAGHTILGIYVKTKDSEV